VVGRLREELVAAPGLSQFECVLRPGISFLQPDQDPLYLRALYETVGDLVEHLNEFVDLNRPVAAEHEGLNVLLE
jgi:hypothetical protein